MTLIDLIRNQSLLTEIIEYIRKHKLVSEQEAFL